jgi:gliding motility-associated-like protein
MLKRILTFLIVLQTISFYIIAGGPPGGGGTLTGPCAQQNTLATVVNCTNCTVVDGTASGSLGGEQALAVQANGCGPVTIRVRYQFDWYQGEDYNWLHGISFNAGALWSSTSFTPPAGWAFMPNGVTGQCSGQSYGPGYYFDGNNITSSPSTLQLQYGNGPSACIATWTNTNGCTPVCNSNENQLGLSVGSGGNNPSACAGLTYPLNINPASGYASGTVNDGNPGNNWGTDCTTNCPDFFFELTFCPNTSNPSTYNQTVSLQTSADGESGAWCLDGNCDIANSFNIQITNACGPPQPTNGAVTLCSTSTTATSLFSSLGWPSGVTPVTTGTWTGPSTLGGGSLGNYTPSTMTPGVYTYTIGTTGCSRTATVTVTESAPPTITAEADLQYCTGASVPLNSFTTSPASGVTVSWTNSNTAIGLAPASGTGNVPAFTATNTTASVISSNITVTPAIGTCLGTPDVYVITVNPDPVIANIATQTCSGTAFSVTPSTTLPNIIPAGTTYSWGAPAGIGFTGGAAGSGGSISGTLTNTGTTAVTATYNVTATSGIAPNQCTTPFTITVTVNPDPVIANIATQTCSGTAFSVTPSTASPNIIPAGTTYSWTAPTGTGFTGGAAGSGSPITGTLTNTGATAVTATYTVTATSGTAPNQCTTPFTVTVTVNPDPVIANITTQTCSGTAFSVTPSTASPNIIPAGTTYSWGAPTGTGFTGGAAGSGSPITGTLTNTGATAVTATYTVTATSGTAPNQCTTPFTVTVTVNPDPVIANITTQTCSGTAFSVTPSAASPNIIPAGTTYSWTAPTGTGFTGGTAGSGSPITGTLTNTGATAVTATYTVTATSGTAPNQCTTPFTVTVTVNPDPVIANITTQTCSGTAFSVTPSAASPNIIPAGTTYSWTAPTGTGYTGGAAGSGIPITGTLTNTGATAVTATYTVTATSGTAPNQCTTPFTVTVTVNPIPVTPTVAVSAPTCLAPGSATISNYNAAYTYTFSPLGPSTGAGGVISGMTLGTSYTVTATIGTCTSTASSAFSIAAQLPLPTAGITPPASTVLTCTTTSLSATATGGGTYSWSGGSTPTTAANTFTAPGTYTVTVTAANGCTDTESITITQDVALPTAGITPPASTVLTCTTTSLSATATGGGTYSWSGGSTPTTAANTFSSAGTYTVTVTAANGCTDTESITITQDVALPTVGITPPASTVLTCTTTSLSATATGGGTYSWSGGSTPTTAANTFSSAGTYTVTVTAANGCTDTESITITSDPSSPTAAITNNTGASELTCTITSIDVTATGGGTYSWSGGSTPTTAGNTFTAPGTYTVTVTAANGCTDTESITITQDVALPTAGITPPASTVLTCTTTSLNATATGGGTYSWSGGSTPTTAANTFTAPGTYIVTVTAANGCTDTESITITQDVALPTAGITPPASTVLTCTTTSLSATATGGGTYNWSGGSTPTTAANTFSSAGTYTVTVTAANGCTDTESITITSDPSSPTAGITNNTGGLELTCTITSIDVTATGGGTYSWSGGSTPTTAANTFTSPGTYTVTVTAANGCTDTESITITQDVTLPTAGITPPASTVLTCTTTSLIATATGGGTYSWSGGSTPTTAANTFTAPGTYTVTVTAANGCTDTESITITQDVALPTAGITPPASTVLTCTTTSLSATATGGGTYNWSGGSTPTTAANIFSSAGTYTVTVTAANGCTDTESITITQDVALPTAGITPPASTVLTCTTTSLSATATGGGTYSWSGGSTPTTAANTFTAPGTYTVTVTAANGCTDTESITITQDVALPTAGITPPASTVLTCTTTSLSATATGGGTYSWSGGSTPTTAANTFTAPGTYTVTVTAANGCTDTETITITSDPSIPVAGITNNTGTTVLTCTTTSISVTASGGVSYVWDNSLGSAVNATITTPGTYTVTATAANGCIDTEVITITQDITAPTAGITNNTGTSVLTCTTTSIDVTATGGTTYSWDGGATPTTAANTFTATGTYTVTATGANGCAATASITITDDIVLPTVGITNNTGTSVLTCTTTSISVTATGGLSYVWDNSLGSLAGATITAPGTYTVTATAANGCIDTEVITITQDITAPTAGITNNTGTSELTCTITSISVTATGGVSYVWDNSLGSAANATITSAGSYTVTATGANGCTDTETIVITSDPSIPTAGITNTTGTTVLTCTTTSISVTATGGVSYVWDNSLGSAANATITAPGIYTVTATAANGCTDTEVITITQDITAPTAGITNNTGTSVLTCTTTSISVTATGGVSYVWDNSLGSLAGATITAPGTYTVTTTAANGCIDTEVITITDDIVLPTVGITNNTGTSVLTCTTTSISVTATGGLSYIWDNSLGSLAGATITAPGTYTVTATAANGCIDTEVITITQDITAPTAGITNNTGTSELTCTITSISVTATGGVSYVWDNSLGSAANATITSAGSYTVTATGANGCTDTETIVITSDPSIPTAGITNNTGTTVLTCTTTSISVTASGGVSYVWDNSLGSAANATITAPGIYTVTATAANGCTDTEVITITQDITAPTAGITNNTGTSVLTCTTTSISVTATGGVSYVWDNSLGSLAGATITAPGTYTVTTTAANGCIDTEVITITDDIVLPTVGITNNTGTSVLTCTTTSISVTATGGLSYIWDNSLGSLAGATITAPGTYTVTATAANGCIDTEVITITQDISAPTAGITNNTGTSELTCTITSISVTATGGVSYVWDNSLGSAANATITSAGSYTVTATGANGCTDTETIVITSDPSIPTAGITNNTGTTVLTCTTISISVTATGGVSYVWDNSLGSAANATITAPGTYTVTATAANGCTDTEVITITQDITAPTAGITNNTGTTVLTCTTTSISVTATGGVSYVWSNSLGSAANATITAPGTYTVTATAANGCTDTEVITVTSNTATSQPDVNSIQPTCAVPTGTITIISALGANYQFSVGGAYQSGNLFSGLAPGTYQVTSIDITNGCVSAATTVVINPVPNSPTVSLVNQDNISCSGLTDGQIEVSVSGGLAPYNQSWSPNAGTGTTIGNLSAGNYTFTVIDANGCSASGTYTISQPATLVVTGIAEDIDCGVSLGSISTNVAGGTGPFTYLWSPGNQSTPDIANLMTGTYGVTVTDANGCVDSETFSIGLTGSLTLDVTPPTANLLEGESVDLLVSGATSYVWTPSTGLSCNDCSNPTASPLETTTYYVTGSDATGCEGATSITIFVEQICDKFFVPNIFSPNETGPESNNNLCIAGECIVELNYQVFNRWGELVFETTDNSVCWDGMHRGKPVGSGVYAYKLYARLANGTIVDQSGSLTVVY